MPQPKQLMTVAAICQRTGLTDEQVRHALKHLKDEPLAYAGNQAIYREATVQRIIAWNKEHGRKRSKK